MDKEIETFITDRREGGNGRFTYPIKCNRTGVVLGRLDLTVSAGHMPYLSHWKEQICYHPLFSMQQHKLCEFMRNEWNRLSGKIEEEEITEKEARILQVGFVALLHSLGSIRQDDDIAVLPSLTVVQNNFHSLLMLNYWQSFLAIKSFKFPELHICRINRNTALESIKDYIDACFQRKKDWEKGRDELAEQDRVRTAEQAILAIRSGIKKPVSKRILWQWVKGNLDTRWAPDAQGWMSTLFLGNAAAILDFDLDEIDLMEEIIVSCCPAGTGVMFAVRERIEAIRKTWKDHYDTFTIEEEGLEAIEEIKKEVGTNPEPKPEDFPKKALYFVAKAKWDLANREARIQQESAEIRNAKYKMEHVRLQQAEIDNLNAELDSEQ